MTGSQVTSPRHVFLATLGQRPQAITVALDTLLEWYPITIAGVIHTDPVASGIAEALRDLKRVIKADYPDLRFQQHEITRRHGLPLLDIVDHETANEYYRGMVEILRTYRDAETTIHLLIAGGRKAMSIYATLAAAVIGGPADHVWTIVSPEELLARSGDYHAPSALRAQVQLIDLPIVRAGHIPGIEETGLIDETGVPLLRRDRLRQQLLARLHPEESRLALLLERYPYESNEQLADRLIKSPRTVENQFHSVYEKMVMLLVQTYPESTLADGQNRRQLLLDILQRRIPLE